MNNVLCLPYLKRSIPYAVLLLCAFLLLTIPRLYRHSQAPVGTTDLWVNGIGEDYYYNLMVIRQGLEGSQEIDQYTTEDTKPAVIHPYYLLLGRIGALFGATPVSMYAIGLYAAVLAYCLGSIVFVRTTLHTRWHIPAFFMLLLCGPFPPISIHIAGYSIPIGTAWWTHMDQFGRLSAMPHHIIGQAGCIVASAFAYRWLTHETYATRYSEVFLPRLEHSDTIFLPLFFYFRSGL